MGGFFAVAGWCRFEKGGKGLFSFSVFYDFPGLDGERDEVAAGRVKMMGRACGISGFAKGGRYPCGVTCIEENEGARAWCARGVRGKYKYILNLSFGGWMCVMGCLMRETWTMQEQSRAGAQSASTAARLTNCDNQIKEKDFIITCYRRIRVKRPANVPPTQQWYPVNHPSTHPPHPPPCYPSKEGRASMPRYKKPTKNPARTAPPPHPHPRVYFLSFFRSSVYLV